MSNLIEAELDYSQKYQLETEKDVKLVKISRENVALVEAMIRYSSYGSAVQNDNPKSAKYCIGLLKKKIKESKPNKMPEDTEIFRGLIEKIVGYIDSENSTHLQADGCGRSVMVQRIVKNKDKLLAWLQTKDYELIRILSKPTNPIPERKNYHSRCNFSFATKFCHYMCFYLFEGSEEQDNFSIYDKIVAQNLYRYTGKNENHQEYIFDSTKAKKETDYSAKFYEKYQKAIDAIRGIKISRNGFDHLLWYFHKTEISPNADKK